jgi:hypothetical protein
VPRQHAPSRSSALASTQAEATHLTSLLTQPKRLH